MTKQRDVRKIWTTLRKLLKKGSNTEYLNQDSCLKHFGTLFTKDDQRLKLGSDLGADYID
jgi:hypothetical protein